MIRTTLTAALGALLLVASAVAQPPKADPDPIPLPLPLPAPEPKAVPLKAPKSVPQPTDAEAATFAKLIRELALKQMPAPLVKANDGWGRQKEFVQGAVMLRSARKFGPDVPREVVNDGLWRRITVTARKPEDTLKVGIADLVKPTAESASLTLNAEMEIDFRVEHQFWKRDRQLYSGETRGHCKAALKMQVQVTTKTEKVPGSFFPSVTLFIKVADAKLYHDKIYVDHTAGLDGEVAQNAGDFVLDLVKTVKPDIEKQLTESANAAIMKAVGAKEIKVELDKVLGTAPAKK
ncbi:MAG: hypothetical protein ACKODX_11550 [Gemmata sp.]